MIESGWGPCVEPHRPSSPKGGRWRWRSPAPCAHVYHKMTKLLASLYLFLLRSSHGQMKERTWEKERWVTGTQGEFGACGRDFLLLLGIAERSKGLLWTCPKKECFWYFVTFLLGCKKVRWKFSHFLVFETGNELAPTFYQVGKVSKISNLNPLLSYMENVHNFWSSRRWN